MSMRFSLDTATWHGFIVYGSLLRTIHPQHDLADAEENLSNANCVYLTPMLQD